MRLERLTPYRPYVVCAVAVALVVFVLPTQGHHAGTQGQVTGAAALAGQPIGQAGTGSQSGGVGASAGASAGATASGVSGGVGAASVGAGGTSPGGIGAARQTAAATAAPVTGAGYGTTAALAAPTCDPSTGRIKAEYRLAPLCVVPFPPGSNNGGATAQGVTATTIKVVRVYQRMSSQTDSDIKAMMAAYNQALQLYQGPGSPWQMWGRKVQLTWFNRSGTDETSQRADAVAVAAMKPFAVITHSTDTNGVFDAEIAKRGILSVGGAVDSVNAAAQSPYRIGDNTDIESSERAVPEMIAKSLMGRPAQFAGDPTMRVQTRKFGVIYEDLVRFKALSDALNTWHVPLAASYQLPSDAGGFAEQAATAIAKMKSNGVTSVIFYTGLLNTPALMSQSTSQKYDPEWVMTGYNFQGVDIFTRAYSPDQSKAFFGLGWLPPIEDGYSGTAFAVRFWHWYFGNITNVDYIDVGEVLTTFFDGVHMAGPDLTAQNIQNGLFALPVSGGWACQCKTTLQASYGHHGLFPWTDYISYEDWSLVWWDPTDQGVDNGLYVQGAGKFRYLMGGQRVVANHMPSGNLNFFSTSDPNSRVDQFVIPPATDVAPRYPCADCPSHRANADYPPTPDQTGE